MSTVTHEAKGRLLDVGCGNKPYRNLFINVTEYIGIDRPSSVDNSRPGFANRRKHYDVVGAGDDLPFKDCLFDTILCTQVIEHFPDPIKFFRESARVSLPEAKLLLTAPLVNPVHEAPYDFFRYTNYGLTELCNRGCWRVKEIKPFGGAWLAIGYLLLLTFDQRVNITSSPMQQRVWRSLGWRAYNLMGWLDKKFPQHETTVGFLLVADKFL